MLADQAGGRFELDMVTPVALVVIVFSIAIVASARAATTIARGIRLPRKGFGGGPQAAETTVSAPVQERLLMLTGPQAASPVARALESAARRDAEESTHRTVAAAMRGSRDTSSSTTTRIAGAATTSGTSETGSRPYLPPPRTRLPRASRAAARRDL